MKKRNQAMFGLLAAIAIVMGGVGFALAQDITDVNESYCFGSGILGLMNGKGFWAQLTEEQRTILEEQTQTMLEEGASHEEIREMKATMLQEWGIDAPQWRGPHYGEQTDGRGRQYGDCSGSGLQYGRRGNSSKGKGYNGNCPNIN